MHATLRHEPRVDLAGPTWHAVKRTRFKCSVANPHANLVAHVHYTPSPAEISIKIINFTILPA